jgi:hypothetical protein
MAAASECSAAPRVLFGEPSPGKPGTAAVGFLLPLPSSIPTFPTVPVANRERVAGLLAIAG